MSCEQKTVAKKISKRVCIPNIKYYPIDCKIVKDEIDIMKPPPQPIGSPFYEPIILPNFSPSSIKRKRNMFSTSDESDEEDEADGEEEEEEILPKKQKIKQKITQKSIENQKIDVDNFLYFINLFETSEFNKLLIDVGFPKEKEITQNSLHKFLTFDDSVD